MSKGEILGWLESLAITLSVFSLMATAVGVVNNWPKVETWGCAASAMLTAFVAALLHRACTRASEK